MAFNQHGTSERQSDGGGGAVAAGSLGELEEREHEEEEQGRLLAKWGCAQGRRETEGRAGESAGWKAQRPGRVQRGLRTPRAGRRADGQTQTDRHQQGLETELDGRTVLRGVDLSMRCLPGGPAREGRKEGRTARAASGRRTGGKVAERRKDAPA